MSSINTACIKISRDSKILEVKKFVFAYQRELWLYNNGFLPSNGVFIHLDGRIAGKFYDIDSNVGIRDFNKLESIPGFVSCDKPISSHKSMWCDLLGAK